VGDLIERKKIARVKQVYAWLADSFPTPYPTKLSLIDSKDKDSKKLCGWVELTNRKLVISLNTSFPRYVILDTLLHEMGHCVSWSHRSMYNFITDHSAQWGIAYAQIYRAFHDEGGVKKSGDY
jgi:hypothetical protein